MKKSEIRELINEALKIRCMQAKAIQKDRGDCKILGWFSTIKSNVACIATYIIPNPGCGDVLGVGSDCALEPPDGKISAVEAIVWEAMLRVARYKMLGRRGR